MTDLTPKNTSTNSNFLYTEIKGQPVIGMLSAANPTVLKVRILVPYYGVEITGKPKMCMLFSEKSYQHLGIKALETAFQLAERLDKRKASLSEDYHQLKSADKTSAEELKDFQRTYLNGFHPSPELLIDPFSDSMNFLETYYANRNLDEELLFQTRYQDKEEAEKLLREILISVESYKRNQKIKELLSKIDHSLD